MLEGTGLGSRRWQGVRRLISTLLVLVVVAQPHSAFADTPPGEAETRDLIREGFAALDKNDLDAAHAAFSAAWKKKQHFAIAFSLAEVEMRRGRYVEAAQHWQYVLTTIPGDLTEKRAQAAQHLKECRPHVGALTVQVKPDGSSIYVDGAVVGESPLAREIYVQPGDHELYAEKSGKRSPIRFLRISGGSKLSFELVVPEPAPPPQTSPPTTAVPVVGRTLGQERTGSSIRTPALIVGLVLTASAAAVGTVFVLKSNAASRDASAAFDQAVILSDPSRDPSAVCGFPDRPAACDTAIALLDDKNRFRNIAIGSFVASGVFALGTGAMLLLWPKRTDDGKAAFRATPTFTRTGGGITLAGPF